LSSTAWFSDEKQEEFFRKEAEYSAELIYSWWKTGNLCQCW